MSILIDETKRVLVQGITGREAMARTKLMLEYGTQVLAGTSPSKAGETVYGVAVYDTVAEAVEQQGQFDISVIFVPGPFVKAAALEAIYAGIPLCVLVPDRVPIHDTLFISELAAERGTRFVGPNTLGVMSPGRALVGMIGGRSEFVRENFKRGPVGVVSRSGGITTSIAYYLNKIGIGQTTVMHVGGDPIVGINLAESLELFEQDDETRALVMFGEIGSTQEEQVASLVSSGEFTKPLIAFIGGAAARHGMRFSHAGAIIEAGRGTYEGKVRALRNAGCLVVENFSDIPHFTREVLGSSS
ncbi:MAG TPA: succinate--CoA ligase subunit alpha [bacterium]|nr:succinate--CoA ligase subunit alpha [bacterium]